MDPLLLRLAGTLPSDSSWFRDVNDFARATPWLHGTARAYASYGLVLVAVLLLAAGVLLANRRIGAVAVVVGYPAARPVIAAVVRRLGATPLKALVASP